MACTPQQCAELNLLLQALQLELQAIDLEMAALTAERESTSNLIDVTVACIDFCECGQAAKAAGGEAPMTPDQKARRDILPALLRLLRRNPPAAHDPKRTDDGQEDH